MFGEAATAGRVQSEYAACADVGAFIEASALDDLAFEDFLYAERRLGVLFCYQQLRRVDLAWRQEEREELWSGWIERFARSGAPFQVVDLPAAVLENSSGYGSCCTGEQANLGGEGIKDERTFPIVLKADTAGSVEAITSSLEGLDVQDDVSRVKAKVIYSGVGDLTKSDIAVASVQGAFVVAFNVGSNAAAMDEERRLSGAVRTNYYSVVYDVLEEIEGKLQKVLSPTPDGELVGTAVVKQCFDIGKLGKVAGCGVETGWIRKSANIRVMRGDAIMYQGRLRTLRSVKVDVERIDAGSDCGLSFRDWEEVEVGDIVEAYEE